MAFTRPTDFPRWTITAAGADIDVVNPTSGKNNVIAPSAAKLNNGFDLAEYPPRQDFNWLFRLGAKWFYWLDQEIQKLRTTYTQSGNASVWLGPATGVVLGNLRIALQRVPGATNDRALCHCHFRAVMTGDAYAIGVEIPTEWRPVVATYDDQCEAAPASAYDVDGPFTVMPGILGLPVRDSSPWGKNAIVFADHQRLIGGTTPIFLNGRTYDLYSSFIYRLYA